MGAAWSACGRRTKNPRIKDKCSRIQNSQTEGYRFLYILNKAYRNITKNMRKYACVPQKSGYNQCQKEQKPLFCVKNDGFSMLETFSTKWEYRKRLRHIYSGGPAGPAPGRGKRERGAGDFRVRCMKKGWCIHDGQGIQTPLPGGAGGDHL